MAPKASSAPSTRLDPPLVEHHRHVRRRRRASDGPPHGQRPRQRAGPGDDTTDTRSSLHWRAQAHTALRTHRQHAGLGGLCRRRHGTPQGDGSDDDAGKQLPVRPGIPHLVPCHSVCTCTLAHAYFPDTGSPTFSLPRPFALCHCCCCRLAAQPKFRAPGLHLELLRDPSWKTRLHFYLFPLLVFAHIPIQTFLDFNAVFILIE
jgi:hypothetical protein